MRKTLTFIVLLFLSAVLLAAILLSLGKFIRISDIKSFAEGKIGSLLKARVSVNEVTVGFLDQISLRGLEINQEIQNKAFYLVDIDKVVFRYNLGHIWRRNFKNPKTIFLESPKLIFRSLASPFIFTQFDKILEEGSRLTDELAFQEGKVSFQIPGYRFHVDLESIQGKLIKMEDANWKLTLEGRVNDLFEGTVMMDGTINIEKKQSSVRIFFNRLNSTRGEELPIKNLSGTVRIDNEDIHFEGVHFEYSRLTLKLEGWVHHFAGNFPEVDLMLHVGDEKGFETAVAIKGKLENSDIQGELRYAQTKIPIRARLYFRERSFYLEDMKIGELFDSQGEFELEEGRFHLYLEHEKQRIDLLLNLKDWNINFRFVVNHIPFFGADLVSNALFELSPDDLVWQEGRWAFKGRLQTDYLILDQTPFPDFQGSFYADSDGIRNTHFRWGKGYELEGELGTRPPFPIDVRIALRKIHLSEIKTFFAKPLPQNFKGVADGGVHLRGENGKVEAEGNMVVSEGNIGSFDYDQLSLRFYGIPPYLKLKDSKLKKGMRTLLLEGGIDLSKSNPFQDVRVSSSEKILIWSGVELVSETDSRTSSKSSIEIPLTKDKKLSVTGHGEKKSDDETYIMVGPKIRF